MNKYNAIRTNGYASKGEANRAAELRLMFAAKVIGNLREQVRYSIVIGGQKICDYVADFVYEENGQTIVEDYKGMQTAVYRLKKKLMKAVYNIDIRETGRRST